MSGNRTIRVVATSARLLTGAAVAVACVAGVVVAITAPWPSVSSRPAQAEVTPLPGDTVLVCNGDFRALGRDTSDPLRMDSAASPRFTMEGTEGEPEIGSLTAGDLAGAGEVRRLTGAVEGRKAPLIGATESVTLQAEDLSGFAAAPCREASTESWLIGGAVVTGAEDLVVLTNPGAVPSTVTLTVYGTTRTSTTSIVPAGAQVALPLAAIAGGTAAPVVNVTATGSPVRAVLQSSLMQTLDPVGVDLQDAVSAPQQHPVIPGVQIFQNEGDDSSANMLRLFSPETETQATVTIRAVGDVEASAVFQMDIPAGVATDVGLPDLDPGLYTVQVDAESAVLAGVRVQDGAGPGSDFAWAMPAPEFTGETLVAVPPGPAAVLVLTNDEAEDVQVTVGPVGGGGGEEQVTVPAGSSASVDVTDGTVYSVRSAAPVHASVSMTGDGALAVWPVWPPAGAEKSVVVYP